MEQLTDTTAHVCKSCRAEMTQAEAATYRGVCENCWASRSRDSGTSLPGRAGAGKGKRQECLRVWSCTVANRLYGLAE